MLYSSGAYNFEYSAMITDQVPAASLYVESAYIIDAIPICFFDNCFNFLGGYELDTIPYLTKIQQCGQREVHDLDLSISITWLGNASLEIAVSVTNNQFYNTPPNTPSEPEGIDTGLVGTEYIFNSMATDPEFQQLYYLWDWGDGQMSDWLGPFGSGEVSNASHTWSDYGLFDITVMVKDELGLESSWSDAGAVSMVVPGDANGDNTCNVGDAVHLINYVFKGGPTPEPLIAGDANCDSQVNVGDAVSIINYVFKGGDPPGC